MFFSMRRLTLCDGKNTDARAKGMTEHLQTHVLKLTSEAIGLSAGIADEITTFYRNYHSSRYVRGQLLIRLQRLPAPDMLARLSADFRDILTQGDMVAV